VNVAGHKQRPEVPAPAIHEPPLRHGLTPQNELLTGAVTGAAVTGALVTVTGTVVTAPVPILQYIPVKPVGHEHNAKLYVI